MNNIINIEKLKFKYNDQYIFDNFNLDIYQGTFTSIIGNNGSGKSTLVRILCGLLNYQGYINIDGNILNDFYLKVIRRKMGVIFDNPEDHFVAETVIDDLAFTLENLQYTKEEMDKEIKYIAKSFKIEDILYSKPQDLTNSQKEIVSIASVLIYKPKILILDESMNYLNSKEKKFIFNILNYYKKHYNLTTILITHDLEDTMHTDRIILLDRGKIIIDEPREKFYSNPIIYKKNIKLPFVIELSNKLKSKKIINKQYYDIDKLMEDLWK